MSRSRRILRALALCSALASGPLRASPQNLYTERGAERGFGSYEMADGFCAGVAAADFDDDGDVDLFVPTALGFPDQLYVNEGDGHFVEAAGALGLDSTENHRGALWIDVDGDRDLDLIVVGDDYTDTPYTGASSIALFHQLPDGTFVDATASSGLEGDRNLQPDTHAGGMCAADLDGDCDLDFYIGFWEGRSYLFRNDGAGVFEDVTAAAGMGAERAYWQPVAFDANGDGRMDLFHAVDFQLNQLWINQGNLTFVDQAVPAGVFNPWNEMGVALGDYDGDGDFDIYVTNQFLGGRHNLLFRNETAGGVPSFAEVAVPLGVHDGGCGWGASFLDGDCGGDLDIATTNTNNCSTVFSRYFENDGAETPSFGDAAFQVGFDDDEQGTGLAAADLDRDGDLELVLACRNGPLLLFDNALTGPAGTQNWLVVRPRMHGANTRAIGAVVRATSGGVTRMRLITAGMSALSQEPAEAHFGLGTATAARVSVTWPDGRVTDHGTRAAGQVLTVWPGVERSCAPRERRSRAANGAPAPVDAPRPSGPAQRP